MPDFDEDGLRDRADVAASNARRLDIERERKKQHAEHQDSLRAAFAAGSLSMADYAKQAREAGMSAAEVGAALKERAAAERHMAERAETAQADAARLDSSAHPPSLAAALAAKAQGIERLRRGEVADAAEAFCDGASLGKDAESEMGAPDVAEPQTAALLQEAHVVRTACLLNEAMCHLKLGSWEAAERVCSEVLKGDPASIKGLYRRGAARMHQARAADALLDLTAAAELSPKDGEIRKLLAQATAACASDATSSTSDAEARPGDAATGAPGATAGAPMPAAPPLPLFSPSLSFDGARVGYVFRSGGSGTGYYLDEATGPIEGEEGPVALRGPDTSARTYCYLALTIGGRAAGALTFQLFDDLVPRTSTNFRLLCEGTLSPSDPSKTVAYRGSRIHRVAKGFVVQGGDIVAGDGSGCVSALDDGGPFEDESFAVPHARPGMLSMANSGPNTNGCQFFVTLGGASACDRKHVAFGRLVDGLPLLRRLEALHVDEHDAPLEEVLISECGVVPPHEATKFRLESAEAAEAEHAAVDLGGEALLRAAADGDLGLMRALLAKGVPVDAFGTVRMPPTDEAESDAGLIAPLTRELGDAAPVDGGAGGTGMEPDGSTPTVDCAALAVAARAGHIDMLGGLLGEGADPDLVDSSGRCAIHWAAESGHAAGVRALLHARAEPSSIDGKGRTALHIAASRGDVGCLSELLPTRAAQVGGAAARAAALPEGASPGGGAGGADVNAEASGLTALHLAALGDFADCVSCLLDAGASHTVRAAAELTPLHLAAARGSLSAVATLLAASADLSAAGERTGKQPLHSACEYGYAMAAAALIAARADPQAADARGSTPLHWACKAGSHDAVVILLGASARADCTTKLGCAPIHLACEAASPKCLAMLLRARASANAVDEGGVRPLHAASAVGSTECVQLLLAEGAEVHAELRIEGKHTLSALSESHSKTPLYLAAENGHTPAVGVLLAAGADVGTMAMTRTDQATTRTSALWAARRGGHSETAEMLVAAGATEHAEVIGAEGVARADPTHIVDPAALQSTPTVLAQPEGHLV